MVVIRLSTHPWVPTAARRGRAAAFDPYEERQRSKDRQTIAAWKTIALATFFIGCLAGSLLSSLAEYSGSLLSTLGIVGGWQAVYV